MTIRIADKIIAGSVNTTEIKSYIDGEVNKLPYVPTGTILPFGGTTAPDGFLICDGSAISRTTYSKLFATIGTAYGAGDGNSTFNIPSFRDKVLQGFGDRGNIGSSLSESLPNITGTLYNSSNEYQDVGIDGGTTSGAIRIVTDSHPRKANGNVTGYDNYNLGWNFDASRVSSTYQDNAPVQQNALLSNMIIKY